MHAWEEKIVSTKVHINYCAEFVQSYHCIISSLRDLLISESDRLLLLVMKKMSL